MRGGGRKPWRQKGLGRARHGSIRSPIWVGGGKAHGPRDRNFVQRAPKKMKALALRSALSARASEGAVKVIGGFDWEVPSTRLAASLLGEIGATGKTLVVVDRSEEIAVRSFRNLPQVILGRPGMLNTYDVLWAGTVIFSGLAPGAGIHRAGRIAIGSLRDLGRGLRHGETARRRPGWEGTRDEGPA